jgi:hypothetical protein
MDAAGVELELLEQMEGEAEEEAARPRRGERIQAARDAVVVEGELLPLREAQGNVPEVAERLR